MADKLKILIAAAIIVAGVTGFYLVGEQGSALLRAGIVIISVIAAAAVALMTSYGQNTWEFALAARTEVRKVVWPTRRETVQGTLVVVVMVIFAGIYLWLLDAVAFWAIYDMILGL